MATIFKKSAKSVDSFAKRSEDIFSIFTQTQEQCKQLNDEIAVEKDKRATEVQRLQAEIATLDTVVAKNNKLHGKITEFLTS